MLSTRLIKPIHQCFTHHIGYTPTSLFPTASVSGGFYNPFMLSFVYYDV